MLAFFYHVLLTLLNPASVSLLLLVASTLLPRRTALRRWTFGLALTVILVCGNGWVVGAMLRSLEWQYLPPDPAPSADAIVVLSGGTLARLWPRSMVEVGDAGDRVLYAADLFRHGRAPIVMVSGNVATGGLTVRPVADDIAELLQTVGVPASAIVLERTAQNTHEHAQFLCPMFAERKVTHVLLVTSAIHMRRALGAFVRGCPAVAYTPAPTDFRATLAIPASRYRRLMSLLPTSRSSVDFSDAAHEYLGLWYYRLRGWA